MDLFKRVESERESDRVRPLVDGTHDTVRPRLFKHKHSLCPGHERASFLCCFPWVCRTLENNQLTLFTPGDLSVWVMRRVTILQHADFHTAKRVFERGHGDRDHVGRDRINAFFIIHWVRRS